jgi:acetylornithine/LysW-gamma-L-lysine aminotransferase
VADLVVDPAVDDLLALGVGDEVREVRGEGLLVGVELKGGANAAARDLALDHGVLALPAGRTVLRLLPPLIIEPAQADAVVDAMAAVVADGGDG